MIMVIYIRKRIKQHKSRTYVYFELVRAFRDPQNKKKIRQVFLAHLGKKSNVQANLERYKEESSGSYSIERLMKVMEKEIKNFPE